MKGQALMSWAIFRLRGRVPDTELSTVQCLVLLGWNFFCSGEVDRALCFFEIAKDVVLEIKGHVLDKLDEQPNQWNGHRRG